MCSSWRGHAMEPVHAGVDTICFSMLLPLLSAPWSQKFWMFASCYCNPGASETQPMLKNSVKEEKPLTILVNDQETDL